LTHYADISVLDSSPILGKKSDNYEILKGFRMDLGESVYF